MNTLFRSLLCVCVSIGLTAALSTASPAMAQTRAEPVEGVQATASRLSAQLVQQLHNTSYAYDTLAITSMVDDRTLQPYTNGDTLQAVGYALSEALYSEVGSRHDYVTDVRGRQYIEVSDSAELNLSRDVAELNEELRVDLVLVGTLSRREHGVMVQTRILNRRNQQVIATASEFLAKRLYWQARQVEMIDGMIERDTRRVPQGYRRLGAGQ